jgi:uncharacterized integral membrane protein
MSGAWLRFKIWVKGIVFALILIYAFAFIWTNADKYVELWWFYNRRTTVRSLTLTIFAFAAGVVGTLLVRTILTTISQVREMRRRNQSDRLAREVADMKAKAARLQTVDRPGGAEGAA